MNNHFESVEIVEGVFSIEISIQLANFIYWEVYKVYL